MVHSLPVGQFAFDPSESFDICAENISFSYIREDESQAVIFSLSGIHGVAYTDICEFKLRDMSRGLGLKGTVCFTPEEQGSSCLTPPSHLLPSLDGTCCSACERHVSG